MITDSFHNNVISYLSTLKDKWKWFVGVGVLLMLLGFLAITYQLVATIFSIYYLAIGMVIAGVVQMVHAFRVKAINNFLFWAGCGLLYGIAGAIALINPLLASSILTLLIAASFIIIGVVRLVDCFKNYRNNSGWLIFSAAITLLLGIIIAIGWPLNSLWLIGLFIGIDLLFQGWGYIALGLTIKATN